MSVTVQERVERTERVEVAGTAGTRHRLVTSTFHLECDRERVESYVASKVRAALEERAAREAMLAAIEEARR